MIIENQKCFGSLNNLNIECSKVCTENGWLVCIGVRQERMKRKSRIKLKKDGREHSL